jgi:hypothetical protein
VLTASRLPTRSLALATRTFTFTKCHRWSEPCSASPSRGSSAPGRAAGAHSPIGGVVLTNHYVVSYTCMLGVDALDMDSFSKIEEGPWWCNSLVWGPFWTSPMSLRTVRAFHSSKNMQLVCYFRFVLNFTHFFFLSERWGIAASTIPRTNSQPYIIEQSFFY